MKYLIPYGKHSGKTPESLSDNVLAGLVWAYSQKRAGNDEIHEECFAVLYERYGTAKAVVELVDKFAAWAGSSKQPKRKTSKKPRKKPKTKSSAFISDFPDDVVIDPNEVCPF